MLAIDWSQPAREQFLDIWEAAADAELPALEQQVQRLYADLTAGPLDVDESRAGSQRVAMRPPLTVWFEVHDGGRRVLIVRVRRPVRRK